MSAHTPGPWHAHHEHGYLVVESQDEDLYLKVCKQFGSARDMANARLIAAAPDAIELARMVIEEYGYAGGDWKSVAKAAQAFIAKATEEKA